MLAEKSFVVRREFMLHNYHTHTVRCNHAIGDEREYIDNAISKGMQTLGFSDHAPYVFPNGYQSGYRVRVEQLFEYADTVRALAKEYEKDIRILCGFELEYYPDFHKEEMEFLNQVHPDYLIMGQHFIGNELNPHITANQFSDDFALVAYVSQVLAGLSTGDFLYLAHPDIAGTRFTKECLEQEYLRLCKGAKRMGIPLEINLLGVREGRHYPSSAFFKIAAETGNDIVLGVDAHAPDHLLNTGEESALEMVNTLGLHLIDKLI